MVYSTIKKKSLRKNSTSFSCMICKRNHRRTKIGSINLIKKLTYRNHELCCACNIMIIHNFVFSELKRILKEIILLPRKSSFDINILKENLIQYLSIKNFFKI